MRWGSALGPTTRFQRQSRRAAAGSRYRTEWASDISAAQQRVLHADGDAQNAGFVVGEVLSVSYTDHGGTVTEQAARQAQAEKRASDIWPRAPFCAPWARKHKNRAASANSQDGGVSRAVLSRADLNAGREPRRLPKILTGILPCA